MPNIAQPDGAGTRFDFAPWVLVLFTGFLGLNVGGALLASVAIFPVWSASPEAAVAWRGLVNEARFFVVVSPLVVVLAVVTLLSSWWAAPEVRLGMRVSAVLYLLFFTATMAYFVPGQAAMQGEAALGVPPAELSVMLQQWVRMNWLRQGVGLLAFGAALHSLGLAYGARCSRATPLAH